MRGRMTAAAAKAGALRARRCAQTAMATRPIRWERGTRYYIVQVHVDLLGTLTVTRAWGRIGTPSGNVLHYPCPDRASAAALLRKVRRERRARGYVRTFGRRRAGVELDH